MDGSSLQRAELRAILRKIGAEVNTAVEPRHVAMIDGVAIETFVSEFGSLAQACLEAGCSYSVSDPDPEVYAAGQGDTQRRKKLISDIARMVNTMGYKPTHQKLRTFGRNYNQETIESFGSWEAAVLETGVDPDLIPGYRAPEDLASEIKRIANLLGRPPSQAFANSQS
jgi:ribosomal protein L12E/L44/L45/RPP1/RPP2